MPPTVPVGVPATLLERRPDVVAGRAAARGGQRRRRRCQGALLSDHQPDGRAGGLSGDFVEAAGRRLDDLVAGRRAVSAAVSTTAATSAITRRRRRASMGDRRSTSRRRSMAIAKWPTRWSTIQKLAQVRTEQRRVSWRCEDAAQLLAIALRHRAVDLPGSADRRPAVVPAGAPARADARRRAAGVRAAVSSARRRMAGRADAGSAGAIHARAGTAPVPVPKP